MASCTCQGWPWEPSVVSEHIPVIRIQAHTHSRNFLRAQQGLQPGSSNRVSLRGTVQSQAAASPPVIEQNFSIVRL